MKISKKIRKLLPIGALIVLIAYIVTRSIYMLLFISITIMLPGMSEFIRALIIVVVGIVLLFLLGYNMKKMFR